MSGPRGSGPCSSYWGRHTGKKNTVPGPSPTPLCRDESPFWKRLPAPFPKLEPAPKIRIKLCQNVQMVHINYTNSFRQTKTKKYVSGLQRQECITDTILLKSFQIKKVQLVKYDQNSKGSPKI